jgi:sulfopyruvate decarboxylase subunit alpha
LGIRFHTQTEVEEVIIQTFKDIGIDFVVTLPEDPTVGLVHKISKDKYFTYVEVVNEGHGVAITAGAALAGRRAVFVTGTAGLLVSTWALANINLIYRVPMVLLVSYRGDIGDQSGIPGEFLYVFGTVAESLVRALSLVPYRIVADKQKLRSSIIGAFNTAIEHKMPILLLLTDGVLW